MRTLILLTVVACICQAHAQAQNPATGPGPLAGTEPLAESTGDARSVAMVAGIDKFVMREIAGSVKNRATLWKRDFSSPEASDKAVQPNRMRLREMLGVLEADKREPLQGLELVATTQSGSNIADAQNYVIHVVRWPVLNGVHGEGLLFRQREDVKARVILLPDADQTPEEVAGLIEGKEALGQCAHELALHGCEVVIPTLISRDKDFSGSVHLNIKTPQPHREWIYRQAFEMGRHVIGYELQKVLSLVEWMNRKGGAPVGIVGYGEGGYLAMCAAALDTRVDATLISGSFENRNDVWRQPIYRNVQGLLTEFGDAEIASLILPRQLVIAFSVYPETVEITGPKATPGRLETPPLEEVRGEVQRLRQLTSGKYDRSLRFVIAEDEAEGKGEPLPVIATSAFLKAMNLSKKAAPSALRHSRNPLPNDTQRQERQVRELERYTQLLLQPCEDERTVRFWRQLLPVKSLEQNVETSKAFREELWNDVIGRYPDPSMPANPRSRFLYETDAFKAYEVMLDVWPDVVAWGYYLVPKDMKEGEKRPVVVCQHGLEGLPEDVVNTDESSGAWKPYKGFAANLATQGYIVFAPHNFYRGKDNFRVVQRKLNLVDKQLFSVIIGQHQRILDWLGSQPNVDGQRIAFYGLSYGGKSAMRIPAVLEKYCLSICSGDFNEWVRKNMSTDFRNSYMFSGEYEIFEWNLGGTYNYAEMAALIAPRPFMVERGHDDGVGIDEWVGWEFAKVKRYYDKLGLPDKTEIEWFNGPHTINGLATYEFLRKHLDWKKK